MSPRATLNALLAALFDPNELRTLCSTELYLGDLSEHLPPPGCSPQELHAGVVAGLAASGRLRPSLFRTLQSLRRNDQHRIDDARRRCLARRVLVVFGGGDRQEHARQLQQDARLAERLTAALEARGQRALLAWPTGPEDPPSLVHTRGVERCDALVLLLSAASATAPSTALLLERLGSRGWPALHVVTTDSSMPPGHLLPALQRGSLHPCTDSAGYASTLDALCAGLEGLLAAAVEHETSGPSDDPWPPMRGTVAGNTRPRTVARSELEAMAKPGETIFQELLERPVGVLLEGGRRTVLVDRRGASELVLTTAAKSALWTERLGSRAGLAAGEAWDAWVERALIDGVAAPPPDAPAPPTRWGGAGVLPIVRWRDDAWVPLLFRDVPPYGWNLPLGASGRDDDMDDPRSWGRRELLEELIVLQGAPRADQPLALRPLLLPGGSPRDALDAALAAALPTVALRARRDRLPITAGPPSGLPGHGWLGQAIPCDPLPCAGDLLVRSDAGARWHRNLLSAPVPLELGIDVVEVLRLELDDGDTIIDGEILERDDGSVELVRMPVAMVRAEALFRLFGPDADPLEPTEALPRSMGCPGLTGDDLHLFPWDVERRARLAEGGQMGDAAIDRRERERYRAWRERFGEHFLDADGAPSAANPCPLFVGATARLLQLWARSMG